MKFASQPIHQLPRERLNTVGVEALHERELLALQLRSGTIGASAADLAEVLLAEFGGLERLASASTAELCRVPGVGRAKAASVVAGFELGRRVTRCTDRPVPMRKAAEVAAFAAAHIGHRRREHALVLVCNRRGVLLHHEVLAVGTDRRCAVGVREVLNVVLRHDGASFAIAHNHPSGGTRPSEADIAVTARLAAGAHTVGVRFIGHVIVTTNDWAAVPTTPSKQMPDSTQQA